MSTKGRILNALGEQALLLPELIGAALAANDRVKYYFSLLQLAIVHADRLGQDRPDLRSERIAAGETEIAFDEAIPGAACVAPETCRVPHAEVLAEHIETAMRTMLAPLVTAGAPRAAEYSARLKTQLADPWLRGGLVDVAATARMTSGARETGDSLHLLVIDLHKAINALQASIASENIDGAQVYGLGDADRVRVAAFMKGVNRTRALKFDHPGLLTTATRVRERLVLQNDIGGTDAHVIVVHVEDLATTLTCTDVHRNRLVFLQGLLERWSVVWSATRTESDPAFEDGVYHLMVGTFRAGSEPELHSYLAGLGSRLVFLIDWNRARKRLQVLVSKSDALDLLRWAAENDVGHMAFLRIGGEQAVFDALASLGKAPTSFGARLEDVLGRQSAVDFLRFALRISAEMLVAGKPAALVQDELRGDLFGRFNSLWQTVLDHASEQIAVTIEIASGVRDCLLNAGLPGASARFGRNAERSKRWERRADELINTVREMAQHSDQAVGIWRLVEAADDISDELEEAAFNLTLLPGDGARSDSVFEHLTGLAGLVVEAAQEYLKAIEAARVVRRGVPRADVQDFFEAVHRIVDIERQTDEAHRSVKATVLGGSNDARTLFMLTEIAANLEAAADGLMHVALMLRDHVLTEVMAA